MKRAAGINENAKICYICKETFWNKYVKDKEYRKVRDHYHYVGEYGGAGHNICNWKYSVTKKIHIAFHNGSNYDHHFIIKELAEGIKKNFLLSSSTWKRSCENW